MVEAGASAASPLHATALRGASALPASDLPSGRACPRISMVRSEEALRCRWSALGQRREPGSVFITIRDLPPKVSSSYVRVPAQFQSDPITMGCEK